MWSFCLALGSLIGSRWLILEIPGEIARESWWLSDLTLTYQVPQTFSNFDMHDFNVHSENFTKNELIVDHVHEFREINWLFHESREYFRSLITGNKFFLSRFTAIKNRGLQIAEKKKKTLARSIFLSRIR